jgi:subtilisin family serine protease
VTIRSLSIRSTSVLIFLLLCVSSIAIAEKAFSPPPIADLPTVEAGVDPLLETSWHLDEIGAFEAWKTTKGSPDVTIAIVDSGIDYNNPEVAANIRRKPSELIENGIDNDGNGFINDGIGWNFNENNRWPWDDDGHGTYVAFIAAGIEGNSLGGAGVCPKCSLLPLRFMDSEGFGDTEDAIKAINYAVMEKVSVINLSFCGEGYDRDLSKALKNALANDIVVVVAAGNEGLNLNNKDEYPQKSRLANMISVAASRRDRNLWVRSNFGSKMIDLAAPGVHIWGPWIDGKWYRSGGTSFAAPVVSGVVGLVRSANRALKATQVVEIIKATVLKVPDLEDRLRTGGIVNADAAVRCAMDPDLTCLKQSAQTSIP